MASSSFRGRLAPSRMHVAVNPLRAAVPSRGYGVKRVTAMKVEMESVGATYAQALVELAQEKKCLEAVHADVGALQRIMSADEDLGTFIQNPVIPAEKKVAVLDSIAREAGFNSYTANFLKLLLQKNRIDAVIEICEAFEKTYYALTDTQPVLLKSAVPLDIKQMEVIAVKLQELTGCKVVKLKTQIDEELIGGFVVEFGSSRIDLSVKGQLEQLSSELNSVTNSL